MDPETILDFFHEQVEARGKATAALVKRGGRYHPVSWMEIRDAASAVGRALVGLGIEAGDRVCIVADTSLAWTTLDLGIMSAAAITVPIYPSSLPAECQFMVDHAGARAVFCQNAAQVAKFTAIRGQLPAVLRIVQMEGALACGDEYAGWVCSFDEFCTLGAARDAALLERRAAISGPSVQTIIYTSGTTGRPKGVVLTHANLVYEGRVVREAGELSTSDVQLIFLPFAHVFAKVLEVAWFASGHIMAFAENMTTIRTNLAEVRPTLMCGVPRVFEKFHGAVVDKGTAAAGLRRRLFLAAISASKGRGEAEERGEALSRTAALRFAILHKLVFTKIGAGLRAALGGRMRWMLSGGAPLSKSVAWFFRDAGLTVLEGYGMTESSAGSCINLPSANQIGTVGPPLPGTEVQIAADGEILIRGPGVMREYWKDPDATAQAIVDGWLHSGDVGEVDPRTGAVRITDRKKDLIITAGGKNIAPQPLEALLRGHELVSQVVVHGDRRRFLSALITLDTERVHLLTKERPSERDPERLAPEAEFRAEIAAWVDACNESLAQHEKIKRFAILDCDFSIEGGELTAKLSVRRKVVERKYGHILDALYEAEDDRH